MKKAILIFLLTLVPFAELVAQDYTKDVAAMISSWTSMNEFALKGILKVFPKPDSEAMTSSMDMKRSGENFYYKVFGNEMLSNNTIMLLMDHTDKTVLVRPVSKKEKKKLETPFSMPMDTTLKSDSVKFDWVGSLKRYRVFMNSTEYKSIELYLTSDNVLSRIVYWHVPSEEEGTMYKSEFLYTFYKLEPTDPVLDIDKVVVKKGKTYVGVGRFGAYQIESQLFEE